jgi:radical SAM superfamily enzyme
MTKCQHEDCERDGIAAWNGCVFCDEHVRERLRTTADADLKAENERLRAALTEAKLQAATWKRIADKALGVADNGEAT